MKTIYKVYWELGIISDRNRFFISRDLAEKFAEKLQECYELIGSTGKMRVEITEVIVNESL